ncbi:MAG: ABC transporter ATP-binding protein [Streptococcus lutetiensis]|uniref:ABC transporter ATP-binding protein n=1 Tax=Streptococcus lutetiensis TaxID=150055 RepID=UPI001BD93A82|nr:ABC transporter ATP-binding protein [Streptococcus lutetiensis]MBT0935130.1 ABC transporter ATP-binding protein/permease [Streptococcus lutetiensis]MBT0936804.1 ABC transporter ATP-binding protein/permease [Streptococcus lutetiensis]MDU2563393.1 ABC transporter ATP-binding protein [Streptococcus lutetiensis]
MIKTLLAQVKEYKTPSLLAPLCAALEVFFDMSVPFVIAKLIDQGVQAENLAVAMKYGILMLVLATCGLTTGFLSGKFAAQASAGFAANLREGMYDNIQTFAFSNIDKYSTAGLVTRMTTDVTNVQNAYQMIIRIVVRAPLTIVVSMIMCFVVDQRLSLIFLAAVLILGASLLFIMRKAMTTFNYVFRKYDDLNASVQENISAIRVVKAFVREKYENKKFTKAAENIYRLFVKAEKIIIFNVPVMMFIIFGCIICLSWFGAQFIVGGTLTTGELTSLMSYIFAMMMSLMMLSMIMVMVSMSTASAERISEVLNEKADIVNPKNPLMEVPNGNIEFNHVHFSYKHGDGEEVLSDIDLSVKSGEIIGIIGGTGSGKTSFANLISRLYDVDAGSVKVGGHDVREYDLEVLRDQVAVVLQKNVLFSGTILDNLRWGNENATDEECMEACRQACADEFIERFPDKYNTWIEQGGSNVSGGQKQRLCIARALLKKPKVLILDDSTSAVDTATDANIRRSFEETIPGTTKIIIAQRISSVQHADKILVLDDGKISGFASHDELLQTNAIYREINEVQQQGNGDFDEEGGNN